MMTPTDKQLLLDEFKALHNHFDVLSHTVEVELIQIKARLIKIMEEVRAK